MFSAGKWKFKKGSEKAKPYGGGDHGGVNVEVPSSTAWPMVLALGLSLLIAGMVTDIAVSLLGLLLFVCGSVGWFFQVLPHEQHANLLVRAEKSAIVSPRASPARRPAGNRHRKVLPVETFHVTTGIKGGIAGGIAMVIPATLYSLLRYHSVWYAANLLAAGGFVRWAHASNAFLGEFHLQGLFAALAIHGVMSVLVGLLYGAILPIYPKYPILSAGLAVPFFFTGLLYSVLGVVSPILNRRIDWFWFVISQIAFGLVCGFVVNLQAKVRTPQFQALPFGVRAGIESDADADAQDSAGNPDKKGLPR